MQRGYVYKKSGSWFVRYYDTVIEAGQTKKKQVARVLAPVADYPKKSSARLLADKHLSKLNTGVVVAESSMSVADFVEKVYFPAQEKRLKPSTLKDYHDIVRVHLKNRLGLRLRDFRTVHGQRIIEEIQSAKPELSHQSMLRIKSFLSGVFTEAKIKGVLDGENPMVGVRCGGVRKKFHGKAYSPDEIHHMMLRDGDFALDDDEFREKHKAPNLPRVPRMVIAVASLTGLRLGEIRGLRWSDFDGENLHIHRSVWRTKVGQPKTEDSEASVPVVPELADALKRFRGKAPDSAYVFAGERRGAPMNLHNLAARVIIPKFEEAKIEWKGWHAFRRGTASLLFELDVEPKIIQAILRHASVQTTMNIYVKPERKASRAAINKLGDHLFPLGW
jgi:integrase